VSSVSPPADGKSAGELPVESEVLDVQGDRTAELEGRAEYEPEEDCEMWRAECDRVRAN